MHSKSGNRFSGQNARHGRWRNRQRKSLFGLLFLQRTEGGSPKPRQGSKPEGPRPFAGLVYASLTGITGAQKRKGDPTRSPSPYAVNLFHLFWCLLEQLTGLFITTVPDRPQNNPAIYRMRVHNRVCSVDFVHDKLSNGWSYKMLTVSDE